MGRRTVTALIVTAVLVGTMIAGSDEEPPDGSGAGGGLLGGGVLAAGALQAFDACDTLLGHLQGEALERVQPWGLEGHGGPVMFMSDAVAVSEGSAGADQAGEADAAGSAVPAPAAEQRRASDGAFSTTNVQEVGVDEADIVKTDGERLFVSTGGRLRYLEVDGGRARLVAEAAIADDGGDLPMLLLGDHVLLVSQRFNPIPADEPAPRSDRDAAIPSRGWGGVPVTVLTLVEVRGTALETVATLEIDGSHLAVRSIGDRVLLALSSPPPALPFSFPDGGVRDEQAALERNRDVIRDSTIDDWLPGMVHTDAAGRSETSRLLACDAVHRPTDFAGFGTLSVLSIDPTDGRLTPDDTAGVLTAGQTVYASHDRFYVTTTTWPDPAPVPVPEEDAVAPGEPVPAPEPEPVTTDVHAFDITLPDDLRYRGSGTVPGSLLNQFSLSEHQGNLRIATTEGATWGASSVSESRVSVLQERGGRLETVGAVTGLGKGERIYAVRFLGDRGYVVTFREIDPLYTLDLSDPTAPRAVGELKIPGYSAYLHPVGDDRLLGVGQEATLEGRPLGTQVSLFDVSDPGDPVRLDQQLISDADSEAEFDHHAFLYWPATGLTVLPVTSWHWEGDDAGREVTGAMAYTVDAERITETGWLTHQRGGGDASSREMGGWDQRIRRSLVIGGVLWTVSERAVVGNALTDLAPIARVDL